MKRITLRLTAFLLSIIMCMTLCSCSAITEMVETISSIINPKGIIEDISLGYTEIDNCDFTYSEHYTPYSTREYYNKLENDKMRELYDMLYENVYFVYPQENSDGEYKTRQAILEDATLTQAQIRVVIKALTDDNPQIFWLSETFGYLIPQDDNYTAVQLYSYYAPQQVAQAVEKLKAQVNPFFAQLEKGMSEYQLELMIHDYIIDNCKYDEDIDLSGGITKDMANAFDSYGAIVDGVAVCEGYSRAFQLLLNGVGIRCINILGNSEGELHMWNAVQLDGDWYYVDVTWDDQEEEAFRYDYFNITEKQLCEDHEFSPLVTELSDAQICGEGELDASTSNFFIPQCDERAYNYYVREAPHLTDYSGDNVIDSLLTSATKKEEYFHLYIDPDEFTYDYAVDQLFYSYPQYFFNYVNAVNYSLTDYSLDTTNLSFYQREKLSVVTVLLNYV